MLYETPPVSVEPTIEISDWEVCRMTYQDSDKTEDRLMGHAHGTWRISSKIVEVKDSTVITKSGRKYTLIGEPGLNDYGALLLKAVKAATTNAEIVTKEYF